jgi:hypothetical protein
MFYPTTKAMLDLANSLKALKAYQGLVSFPELRPRGLGPLGSQACCSIRMQLQGAM